MRVSGSLNDNSCIALKHVPSFQAMSGQIEGGTRFRPSTLRCLAPKLPPEEPRRHTQKLSILGLTKRGVPSNLDYDAYQIFNTIIQSGTISAELSGLSHPILLFKTSNNCNISD